MNKYIVVFAAVLSVCLAELSDEQKAKLKQHHQECVAATGVDEALITKARNGEFTEDAKLKEHILCISKKIGFQNDAGDIQKDTIKAKLMSVLNDETKVDAVISKCAVQKDTPQETAYQTIKCYRESAPVL